MKFLMLVICLFLGLFLATVHVSADVLNEPGSAAQTPLCPLPDEAQGAFFSEIWEGDVSLPDGRWDSQNRHWDSGWLDAWQPAAGDWVDPAPAEAGTIRQNSQVVTQANVAYELETDIADGVILTCMQLLQAPVSETPFPHGVLFRMHDPDNFYGVGFLDDTTLVLGKLVNSVPIPLQTAGGFVSTEINRFKIILAGENVQVYVAQGTAPFEETPTFNFTEAALGQPPFQTGKIGLGTYEVQADFGPVAVGELLPYLLFLPVVTVP